MIIINYLALLEEEKMAFLNIMEILIIILLNIFILRIY